MFLRKTTLIFSSLFLMCSVGLKAQFVNNGSDPFKYKWNIAKTNHFNIIYTQGNDSVAQRYASLLETAYPHVKRTINQSKDWRFPVVLHPGNMLSNGMVSWAPRRMEIITTPSSDMYAQQWDRQLVLHESRHIFQTNKVVRGIFKPLYYGLGEQSAGLASFLLPTWFLEGDAVVSETALSSSGRGRLPEFNMVYRAHMVLGQSFSYDKWYMGSYKDYTGSKYSFGYNMISYARYKFGEDVWDKVTSRYADRILNIPPFSNALKHHTGIGLDTLYKDTYSFLLEEWKRQDNLYQQSGFSPSYLLPQPKEYTSYKYPQALNDSTVIVVKSHLRDLNSLVSVTNGKEERIAYLGSINSRITLRDNSIYWSEIVPGLRWTHLNYSVVKKLNLANGKITILTPKKRYLSPSPNDSGTSVAISLVTEEGKNQIVLIDAETGEERFYYDIPENAFAKEITYAGNDKLIVVAIGTNGISLLQLNTTNGEWQELLSPTWANITSPVWNNGKLYFESGIDGTNNIYVLNPSDNKPLKLTTARFGAFTPTLSADKKKLLFADFQTSGYNLASVSLSDLNAKPASFDNPYKHTLAEVISEQEAFNLDTVNIQPVEFKPKRYHRLPHLFKIHSWAPFYYDVMDIVSMNTDDFSTIVKPGATILSQNTLNTTITQAGWYYKDKYHHGKLAFTYMGWYPIIDLTVDYGSKAFSTQWVKNEETGAESMKAYRTDRNLVEAEARVYVPFNFTKNHYIRGFQPSVTYYYTNNKYQQYKSRKLKDFQYMLSELRFYNYRRMAKRDILPRWGYQLRLQHMFSPMNSENYGNLYATRLTSYFPGILPNHGLMLRFGYQFQDIDNKTLYLPKRIINEPRGYNYLYSTRQQWTVKADYSFTIASPDFSIGPMLYIQRIRSNIFYDYNRNQAKKHASWVTQSSYGAELIMDCNVFQIEFPLAVGARIIKPVNYGDVQVEGVFSVSF